MQVQIDAFGIGLHRFRPRDFRPHQRHAKFLDAKAARKPRRPARAGTRIQRVGHLHDVGPLFRALGNLPRAFRDIARVPCHRHFVFLVRTLVHDREFLRQVVHGHEGETLRLVPAVVVLHVHGLPGAQQRAVEHRGDEVRPVPAAFAQVEAPVRNALVPVGHDERQVVRETGGDHQLLVVLRNAAGQAFAIRQHGGDTGASLCVGRPAKEDSSRAILDRDQRLCYRRATVQCRDPDQRGFATPFEMHGEIRDECRGLHEVRRMRIQQRRAQARTGQLDHVEAGLLQRDADYLERARAVRLRYLQARNAIAFGKNGGLAQPVFGDVLVRLVVVAPALVLHLAQAFHPVQHGHHVTVGHARVAAGHRATALLRLVELVLQPVDRRVGLFRRIAAGLVLRTGSGNTALDHRLQIAQGHRHHAVALRLDDAEARRKFRQRRILVRAYQQRETFLVDELAAGIVSQFRRHIDGKLRALRKRSVEKHFVNEFRRVLDVRQSRGNRLALCLHHDFFRGSTRHRRGERQSHRQDRQALRVLVHPVAGKARLESVAHLVSEDLILAARHAAFRDDSPTPHQPDLRLVRQAAFALQ